MRILSIRPAPPGAGTGLCARFDLELSAEVRLHGLRLHRNRVGQLRTFAPNAEGASVATFAPELADRITAAAERALQELSQNDRNSRN